MIYAIQGDILSPGKTGFHELLGSEEAPELGWADGDASLGIALGLGSWGLDLWGPEHHQKKGT